MCGIIGVSGSLFNNSLNNLVTTLEHRGPDSSGVFMESEYKVGLGHTRLSIQDLTEKGNQPLFSKTKKAVLIYNGEIYNCESLKKELISEGFSFQSNSDSEILLNLYISKGLNFVKMLNGIFAFAIWDYEEKFLYIARDGFGIKPLYFTQSKHGFAFASEIKSLVPLLTDRSFDPQSLNRYLTFLWCPGAGTGFKSVSKFTPGNAMIVRNGVVTKQWSWFKPPVSTAGGTKVLSSFESIHGIRKLLKKSVSRQMVSDVPVGAFLSGGLDSSSVVAFAKDIDPGIRCFTIENEGGKESGFTDDLPYARSIADYLNVPLDVVKVDANRIASDLQNMVWQLDEPLADPACLNVYYISKLASENGIKVLLSGAGGDDIFTGYRRHRAIDAERLWSWMPKNVRRLLSSSTRYLDQSNAFNRRLTKWLSGAKYQGDQRLINYFKWIQPDYLNMLYTPEFRAEINHSRAESPMLDFLADVPIETSRLERMLLLEQRFFLADHNLNYTDKMSMASGVEVRVPFLDSELVEFASKIPISYKQCGKEGKWVLKKAMEPFLPHSVIYRSKTGFGAPIRRWIVQDLKEMLEDLLSFDSLNRRGIFDSSAVHQLISNNFKGKVDASYTLFSILCIEIWCRRFIDDVDSDKIS
jgi:asparagine synthase (glutamine-hydrolysing)